MSDLSKESIESLSKLSRIALTDEEKQALFADLEKILTYIEMLDEVDTEGARPCNSVLAELQSVFREDQIEKILPREDFLNNAPEQIGGLIRVPTVIKKN